MSHSLDNPPANGAARTPPQGDMSFITLLGVLLRNRWLIVGFAVVTAAVLAGLTLSQPRQWTAHAAFLPQAQENRYGNLSGLAAQFGVAMPAGGNAESPLFYAELIRSSELLGAVVDTEYRFSEGGRVRAGNLPTLLQREGSRPALARELAVAELREMLTVRTSRETGIVRLEVQTEHAPLSALIAERIVELLHEFNLRTRTTQAAEERRFVEARLNEARGELVEAENALEAFLMRNRQFQDPSLQFERDRLQRRVSERQQTVTSLVQSYDHARIEEVRNTPVFTVLERPSTPLIPAGRGLLLNVVLGFLLGAGAGVLVALARDLSRRHRDQPDMQELATIREEAMAELMWPVRRVRGVVSGRS